jgi:hypothetical protein
MADDRAAARPGSVRAILQDYAVGPPEELLRLRDLLQGLGRRSFGMLLLIATLPAFIPIPVGGAISGPLAMLIGAQLLAGMNRPWLPRFLAERGPHRSVMVRFDQRISPWLARLEKLVKPRMELMLAHRAATVVTGALLLLTGLLLSLPIPLTNYVFGGLLLAFAMALLERDGVLMLIAWVAAAVSIAVFGVLSGSLATVAGQWVDRLF